MRTKPLLIALNICLLNISVNVEIHVVIEAIYVVVGHNTFYHTFIAISLRSCFEVLKSFSIMF